MNINNIDIFKERIVKECAACQSYTLIISALLNLTDFLLLFCLHDSIHLKHEVSDYPYYSMPVWTGV